MSTAVAQPILTDGNKSVRFADMEPITKAQAIKPYGTVAGLARKLNVSRQLVSRWPEGPIPDLYALRLRYELAPEKFGPKKPKRGPARDE